MGLILNACIIYSCENNNTHRSGNKVSKHVVKPAPISILVLPLGNVPKAVLNPVCKKLVAVYSNTRLLPQAALPLFAYYSPRGRYKADSLISWMGKMAKPNEVYIGITTSDISSAKGNNPDWGVMGLGYQPGPACIVSTFRLHKNNLNEELFKVAIHEAGHTMGLDHCKVRTCFMRDAEGKNSTGEENEFCSKCKNYLVAKGWIL